MKKITLLASSVALCAAMATGASAQGAPTSLGGIVGGAGGLGVGAVVGIAVATIVVVGVAVNNNNSTNDTATLTTN